MDDLLDKNNIMFSINSELTGKTIHLHQSFEAPISLWLDMCWGLSEIF
jgi:hypothetical protein